MSTRLTHVAPANLMMALLLSVWGCGEHGLEGTYHHPQGAFALEIRSNDEAVVQLFGQTVRCTYRATAEAVVLTCPPEASMVQTLIGTLQRNRDGTLSSVSGVLAKRESS